MLNLALVLFAIAAVFGAIMAIMHFRGSTPPRGMLAILHGVAAASGLVVFLLALLKTGVHGPAGLSLLLFLIAALGGFFLLSFHLRGRALPNGVVIVHGLVAVCGFGLLAAVLLAWL
jgi:hypothetical protein